MKIRPDIINRENASSHKLTPGRIYSGQVKAVDVSGKVSVFIGELGCSYGDVVPLNTTPNTKYAVGDIVKCIFTDEFFTDIVILGSARVGNDRYPTIEQYTDVVENVEAIESFIDGGAQYTALTKSSSANFDLTWSELAFFPPVAWKASQNFVWWTLGQDASVSGAPTTNTLYFSPIWFPSPLLTDMQGIYFRGTQTANSSLRAGLFKTANGRPSELVSGSAVLTSALSSASTANVSFSSPIRPAPGLYWIGVVSQGAGQTPLWRNNNGGLMRFVIPGNGSIVAGFGYTLSGVSGTLPTSVTQSSLSESTTVIPSAGIVIN